MAAACVVPVPAAFGVVGGIPVSEESVPWFASIASGCGGTLVAPDRVLTAGHCLRGSSLRDIGAIRVAGSVRHGVRFALHPDWRRKDGRNLLEDAALIKLDRPVLGVPAVTLGGPIPKGVKVLGRGVYTAPSRDSAGFEDDRLRGADLAPITDARCARRYRHHRGNDGERFRAVQMLCTTDFDGRPPLSSPCFGDSGGPLYSGSQRAPVLHGVVSWAGDRCGADRLPAVYASVRPARRFIRARHPTWAPVPRSPAVISGRPRPGHRITCTIRSWIVRPTTIRVRWEGWRSGLPEPIGRGRTYMIRRRDSGRSIGCTIKAANAGGLITATDGSRAVIKLP